MTKKYIALFLLRIVAGSLLAIGLSLFILLDPYEWGVIESREFTWGKFASVKNGEPIEAVIARLGQPVRKPYEISVMTTDPNDPCVPKKCVEYLFAGARWGVSYKEAIVITDHRGYVVNAQARQE
jgi:hypothetical protein